MKSRFTAVLTTLGLAAAGVAAAAPAYADGLCSINNFTPRSVTVGLSNTTSVFSVSTSNCHVSLWDATNKDFFVYKDGRTSTFYPWIMKNSQAGASTVTVTAHNQDFTESVRRFGFNLKRNSTWQSKSFNASPE